MTFLESLKIIWLSQFTLGLIVFFLEFKDFQKEMEELTPEYPEPLLKALLFLLVLFGGWWLAFHYVRDRCPFWLAHPRVWFYFEVQYPAKQKLRNFKAWQYKQKRKAA